jgi:YHS domain-containing protein
MVVLAMLMAQGPPAFSQSRPVPAGKVCKNADGVAVGGYDVVSYFTEKKPEQGSALISLKHEGAEYRFISATHRDQFAANPEAFLPQYGGHCAYGMGKGKAFTGDPQAWLIHKGKLYLTVSREALAAFQSNLAAAIQQADEIWRRLY